MTRSSLPPGICLPLAERPGPGRRRACICGGLTARLPRPKLWRRRFCSCCARASAIGRLPSPRRMTPPGARFCRPSCGSMVSLRILPDSGPCCRSRCLRWSSPRWMPPPAAWSGKTSCAGSNPAWLVSRGRMSICLRITPSFGTSPAAAGRLIGRPTLQATMPRGTTMLGPSLPS